jgi:hypothetical protein
VVSEAETEEIRDPRIVAKSNRFEMLKNNEFRFILMNVGINSQKREPFIFY